MNDLQKIATFIFLDLEGTGVEMRTHITEIALVAIHRSTLGTKSEQLRVVDKLIVCVHPMKAISAGAASITGLDNYNLEYQKEFDSSLVDMMNLFIKRHVPPVCIVAHNGKGYDFGLLKTELKRVDCCFPANVLCVDSLDFFRALDGLDPMYDLVYDIKSEMMNLADRDSERSGATPLKKKSSMSRDGEMVKRQLFPANDQECSSPKKGKCSLKQPSKQQMKERKQSSSHAVCTDWCVQPDSMNSDSDTLPFLECESKSHPDIDADAVDKIEEEIKKESLESNALSSPPESPVRSPGGLAKSPELNGSDSYHCCQSPEAVKESDKTFNSLSSSESLSDSQFMMHIEQLEENYSLQDEVIKQNEKSVQDCNHHFGLETPTKLVLNPKPNKQVTKGRHKLSEIYKRLTGKYPDHEHRAEDDCMTLAEIFRISSPDILLWCDKTAVPFSNIPIRYEPKPRRQLPWDVFPFQS